MGVSTIGYNQRPNIYFPLLGPSAGIVLVTYELFPMDLQPNVLQMEFNGPGFFGRLIAIPDRNSEIAKYLILSKSARGRVGLIDSFKRLPQHEICFVHQRTTYC